MIEYTVGEKMLLTADEKAPEPHTECKPMIVPDANAVLRRKARAAFASIVHFERDVSGYTLKDAIDAVVMVMASQDPNLQPLTAAQLKIVRQAITG